MAWEDPKFDFIPIPMVITTLFHQTSQDIAFGSWNFAKNNNSD